MTTSLTEAWCRRAADNVTLLRQVQSRSTSDTLRLSLALRHTTLPPPTNADVRMPASVDHDPGDWGSLHARACPGFRRRLYSFPPPSDPHGVCVSAFAMSRNCDFPALRSRDTNVVTLSCQRCKSSRSFVPQQIASLRSKRYVVSECLRIILFVRRRHQRAHQVCLFIIRAIGL